MEELWKAALEISTLLGGLSALVFFFDRFRRTRIRSGNFRRSNAPSALRAQRRIPHRAHSSSEPLPAAKGWSAAAVALSMLGCSGLGVIGFKFGFFVYIFAALCSLGAWLLGLMFKSKNVVALFFYSGYSVFAGGMFAGIAVIIFNFMIGGDAGLYAGTTLSVLAAVLCVLLGLFICYGFLRLKWFGEPWES